MTGPGVPRPRGAGASRVVLAHPRRDGEFAHEAASQEALARAIAGLLGCEFMAERDFARLDHAEPPYCVPGDTLVDAERMADPWLAGIRDERDFFGGMVPRAFIATKAITHALIDPQARRPAGWSEEFGRDVRAAVLRGATVFSSADARRAGRILLHAGPIRAKSTQASGGRGQRVVRDAAALDEAIGEYEERTLAQCGLVFEEHLEDVRTYSVGRVCVGNLVSTYVGTQSLTSDGAGAQVYGGSELRLVRGDFEALLASALSEDEREAARLALAYDRAALRCYPGLVASRRNYDVVRGTDAAGRIRYGVLEQSWRAGGASMAEACALLAFHERPDLRSVHAYTCERYGEAHTPPAGARLVYRGEDGRGEPMSKYAGISSYGDD